MDVNFVLDVGERSFEGIGGIRHAEVRVMMECEEPGKICFETPVGTPETFVREVPTFREFIDGFLSKEVLPPLVPEREPVLETFFICFR